MNITGIKIGIATFLLIGVFHVIVIKAEYYFTKNIWPLFLVLGLAALFASLKIDSTVVSSVISIFGISCLWSIKELFEQERRVKKGWFPKNPNRV
ncbi:DUF4491 family protein [bacterium D16-54]|nr:DUF4491 family protein [bacterium D16-54]RKJ16850.1 DUF4491 family protein [bacterium D16-56]